MAQRKVVTNKMDRKGLPIAFNKKISFGLFITTVIKVIMEKNGAEFYLFKIKKIQ